MPLLNYPDRANLRALQLELDAAYARSPEASRSGSDGRITISFASLGERSAGAHPFKVTAVTIYSDAFGLPGPRHHFASTQEALQAVRNWPGMREA